MQVLLVALMVVAAGPPTVPDGPAVLAPAPPSAPAPVVAAPLPPPAPRYCPGAYADEFSALSERAREFEQRQPPYTYCIRTTAVYECPSYAADGTIRRTRRKVVAHGTGFGYRQEGGETLVLTNQHVAEWPAVTDEDHVAGDVPAGCKRVSDSIRIVENERDDYERDDVPLARVVTDPQLDVAVLRARVLLPTVPWKLGHSAALRERNAVDVRGFPLGVLRANNVGKVVSAYDHDDDRDWDHDDFVVDALLSPGNSGSPVFAISCTTGEFELVGIYHAAYSKGSALNVVVGIDQLRDLLTTLKRSPRPHRDAAGLPDAGDRARLLDLVRAEPEPLFFPFGSYAGAARTRPDGALVFALMSKDFPLQEHPALVLEDLPPAVSDAFGRCGRVWAGNRQGLREAERSAMDAETQGSLVKLLEAFRRSALLAGSHRAAVRAGMTTREQYLAAQRLERSLRRTSQGYQDLAQAAADVVERLCPATADAPATLADVLLLPSHDAQALVMAPADPGGFRLGPNGATPRDWHLVLCSGSIARPPVPPATSAR